MNQQHHRQFLFGIFAIRIRQIDANGTYAVRCLPFDFNFRPGQRLIINKDGHPFFYIIDKADEARALIGFACRTVQPRQRTAFIRLGRQECNSPRFQQKMGRGGEFFFFVDRNNYGDFFGIKRF